LYNAVGDFVESQIDSGFSDLHHEELHGRLESRTYIHFAIPKEFPLDEKWVGIKSIGVVIRETISGSRHSVERSFYISSLPVNVTQFSKSVRSHWVLKIAVTGPLTLAGGRTRCGPWNCVRRRIWHGSVGSPCHYSSSVRTSTAWLEGVVSAGEAKSS
jgi:hypothetical protein